MTFRKVTPAALKVNVKKFWQVLLVPWHVWAPIWVHFAPWWSIFPVKNRFSHIFPVPGGLPFLTVILTVKLARLLQIKSLFKSRSSLELCCCDASQCQLSAAIFNLQQVVHSGWIDSRWISCQSRWDPQPNCFHHGPPSLPIGPVNWENSQWTTSVTKHKKSYQKGWQ